MHSTNSCFENKNKINKFVSSGPLTVAKALHELVLPNMDSQVPKIDTHTHNGSRASRPHGRTSRRKGDAGRPTPRRVHTHTHTHTHTHKHTHTQKHTHMHTHTHTHTHTHKPHGRSSPSVPAPARLQSEVRGCLRFVGLCCSVCARTRQHIWCVCVYVCVYKLYMRVCI